MRVRWFEDSIARMRAASVGVLAVVLLVSVVSSVAPAALAGDEAITAADYPVTGHAAPELESIDRALTEFMAENGIRGGVFGLMKDGQILMERGYGWRDEALSEPMNPDALMRIASITKPIVAAAIRELIEDGEFSLDSYAFDLGQEGGGVLPVEPFPELGDERLKKVTIEHLLTHKGGWDRSEVGDLTYREVDIAQAFEVDSPPGRERTVRYILGQPLQHDPGEERVYSNIGYLVAGMIVEHVSGQDLIAFIHERVLGPIGVEPTEHMLGRTFRELHNDREPFYHNPSDAVNVFNPDGPRVNRAYGGWDHEARVGQGGHITTTRTLLTFLDHRFINGPSIGLPRKGSEGGGWRWNHGGTLPGTNALARQRGDGVNFTVIFNKRHTESPSYSVQVRRMIDDMLDNGEIEWSE